MVVAEKMNPMPCKQFDDGAGNDLVRGLMVTSALIL